VGDIKTQHVIAKIDALGPLGYFARMPNLDLREEEFRDRFTMRDFIDAGRRAFELHGGGDIINPPRQQVIEERDGCSHFRLDMPAEWPGHYRVRKIIEEVSTLGSGNLGERRAWIELQDLRADTAVRLDAGHITDMRTGAAGALAIELLAEAEVQRIGILGTGRIARCLALACDDLFELAELRCTSRSASNRDAFAAGLGPQLQCQNLQMSPSIEACVNCVDAVLTAAPTTTPILDANLVAQIDTVVAIAGDARTRQLHAEVLEKRPVIVDVLEQAQASGEFQYAVQQGTEAGIRLARRADGTVLTMSDAACHRVSRGGVTAYLTGMAAQDLCAAVMIYEGSRPWASEPMV